MEAAALGSLEILNHNIIQTIEMNSTQRGYDPREFTLVAFGGAGPLQACSIALELGIPHVLVPPLPGITSAIGLLLSDVSYDYSKTEMQLLDKPDLEKLTKDFRKMEAEAYAQLKKDGFGDDFITLKRIVECRYLGQSYELRVPMGLGKVTKESMEKLILDFQTVHKQEYGIKLPEEVEMVHARVLGIGKIPRPKWEKIKQGPASPKKSFKYERPVFFDLDGKKQWVQTGCFERRLLEAGNIIKGPAILEQPDATTVILPDLEGKVDEFGNVLINTLIEPKPN